MIKNIHQSIIFLLLLSCIQLGAEGIIAGTCVVTPQGYQSIEELTVGDTVTCCDFRTLRTTQHTITHITHHTTDHLIQLTINGDVLLVDVHQRVYLPVERRWCQAKKLTPGDTVLASLDNVLYHLMLDDVSIVDGAYEVYELTVPFYHNFCISKYGIITHNVFLLDDIAIVPIITPLLTIAGTATTAIVAKITTVLGVLFCATPVALTSGQAAVVAATTTIGVGAAIFHDSRKAQRTQQFLEKKQREVRSIENKSYAIRVHDKTYTCEEKLGMPSVSEITHLNLGPDKPGPICPRHNPPRKVRYYDEDKLVTGPELAKVKQEDIARRRAEKSLRLLPSVVSAQKPPTVPSICPASTNTQETKKSVCGTTQQMPPATSTCPSATDLKEPAPACGLQETKIPVPPQQPCSSTVETKMAATPCNTSQVSKTKPTKNVGTKLPKNGIEKHSPLRKNTSIATTQSNLGTVVEDVKAAASLPSQKYEEKEAPEGILCKLADKSIKKHCTKSVDSSKFFSEDRGLDVQRTNKQTLEIAEQLGFKKTNFYSHGKPVFQKGNRFITIDVDSHNGGFWKMANSVENLSSKKTRLGTYDKNLNRIGD